MSTDTRPRRRWVTPMLLLLLVATFGLRLWLLAHDLHGGRFFDERFSLVNVKQLLVQGTLQPETAYYPSLSWVPQALVVGASEWLSGVTGRAALSAFDDAYLDGWSSTAYLLVRLVSAIWGTLSVWVCFLVGRRVFDERVGLLGAAFLAAAPRHLLVSVQFKPDAAVVLFVLLAFLWSLSAVASPSRGRYALAGVGVGLAIAAKYTAVGAAIPLTVGTLAFGGWRVLRRWGLLVLAGLASIGAFLALNPHLAILVDFLPRLWGIAKNKEAVHHGTRAQVVVDAAAFVWRNHPWLLSVVAAVGLVGLVWRLRSGLEGRPERRPALMVLSYVVGFAALHLAVLRIFRGHYFVPTLAFTGLAAAWVVVGGWDRLVVLRPRCGRRGVGLLAGALGAAVAFAPAVWMAYQDIVPSNFDRALDVILRDLGPEADRRLVIFERGGQPLRAFHRGHEIVFEAVDRLADVPTAVLDGYDAEMFLSRRLDEPEADWHLLRTLGGLPIRFESRLFESHGPGVVLVMRPWTLDGKGAALELRGLRRRNGFAVELETPLVPGQTFSLSVWMPREDQHPRPSRLLLVAPGRGRRVLAELPLYRTSLWRDRHHYLTPRTRLEVSVEEVILQFEESLGLPWAPEVTLWRWQPR